MLKICHSGLRIIADHCIFPFLFIKLCGEKGESFQNFHVYLFCAGWFGNTIFLQGKLTRRERERNAVKESEDLCLIKTVAKPGNQSSLTAIQAFTTTIKSRLVKSVFPCARYFRVVTGSKVWDQWPHAPLQQDDTQPNRPRHLGAESLLLPPDKCKTMNPRTYWILCLSGGVELLKLWKSC